MTARYQKMGSIRFFLPVMGLPALFGVVLLAQFHASGTGNSFSNWLEETWGITHTPAVSRLIDDWTGTTGRQQEGESPRIRQATARRPRQVTPSLDREIRRLLADRPQRGSMADDFAGVRDALARDLVLLAGMSGERPAPILANSR